MYSEGLREALEKLPAKMFDIDGEAAAVEVILERHESGMGPRIENVIKDIEGAAFTGACARRRVSRRPFCAPPRGITGAGGGRGRGAGVRG